LPGGMLSNALAFASALAARSSSIYATPVSKVLSLGSTVAAMLGWARPPEVAQTVVVARKHGSLALGTGQPDFSSQFGIDPNESRNVDMPYIPMKEAADTNIYALSKQFCQLTSGWNISVGLPCHPGFVAGSSATVLFPTRLAYLAWCFVQWNGSLRYKVVVHGSPLVRARLGINIVPPGVAFPSSFVSNGTALSYVMEVAGTTELEFDVPYMFLNPWEPMVKALITSVAITDYTRLAFFWLTASSGPAVTPITLPISIFVAGGEDYQLAVPTLAVLEGTAFAASGVGLLDEFVEEGKTVETFGEIVEDVRVLMRRPVHHVSCLMIATTGSTTHFSFPCDGLPRLPDGTAINASPNLVRVYNSRLTYFQYLRAPYLGYSGGSNLKVVPTGIAMTTGESARAYIGGWALGQYMGYTFDPFQNSGNGADIFQYPEQVVFEMSNPDRCSMHWKFPGWVQNSTPVAVSQTACYTLYAFTTPTAEAESIYEVFLSARDDVNVGGWMSAPTVYV